MPSSLIRDVLELILVSSLSKGYGSSNRFTFSIFKLLKPFSFLTGTKWGVLIFFTLKTHVKCENVEKIMIKM